MTSISARFFIQFLFCLGSNVLCAAPDFWDEIPLSPSTTMPVKVQDDYWNGEFQRVNREVAAAQNTRLVFFGDSITWSWSLGPATGREIWENQFKDHHPINMGNSGDITPVMLYRVTHGNLDFPEGKQPKVAVLLCGINNFGVTQSDGGKEKWAKCQQVNATNAAVDYKRDEVAYVNLQVKFLLSDGTINRSLFTDGIHLTTDGYRVWAKGIEPLVRQFMDAPPLHPEKIMLIGDSITEGLDSSTSCRHYLDGMLRRSGRQIDLIGGRKKHNDDRTEPDNYQYDVDHEGHWGKDSAWMAENMQRLLAGNVPDVAVIHLGTDEVVTSKAAAEPLTESIVRNINQMIEALRSKNANVRIVLSKVMSMKGRGDVMDLLNVKISQYAQSHSTPRQPVVLADPNVGFDISHDLTDAGIIPKQAEQEKWRKHSPKQFNACPAMPNTHDPLCMTNRSI